MDFESSYPTVLLITPLISSHEPPSKVLSSKAAWRVPYRENSDQRPLLREQREVDV